MFVFIEQEAFFGGDILEKSREPGEVPGQTAFQKASELEEEEMEDSQVSPQVKNWAAFREKFPNVLSRYHTKRKKAN